MHKRKEVTQRKGVFSKLLVSYIKEVKIMKRIIKSISVIIFSILFLSNTSIATPITADLKQIIYGSGTITYENYGPTFTGSLTVRDLEPGMVYQIKLEGQPADNLQGNINLGSIGRWWVNRSIGSFWMGW